jgi:hypothetical protein
MLALLTREMLCREPHAAPATGMGSKVHNAEQTAILEEAMA